MTIKAVLFDLDETLFERSTSLRLFLADQLSRHSVLEGIEQEHFIVSFLQLDQRGRVSKSTVYRELLLMFSIDDHETAAELFKDYENNFWRFARAYSGADEMFDALRQQGVKTGIVTNGQTHIQLRSLLGLNLDRQVDVYVISEAEGLRKPDRAIFALAATRLGVNMSECIFVGDTPGADIVGAQQCGMKGVWFPNGAVWPAELDGAPDVEIINLKEIADLVQQWS